VVEVERDRVPGWFDRFGQRNGGVLSTEIGPEEVVVVAGDGTTATAKVPFTPLEITGRREGLWIDPLLDHLARSRRVGLLLVRLGAHSVGVAENTGDEITVLVSRTDRHLVHGRSAAGGWSQQRFARRREGQAKRALQSTARDAAEILGSRAAELDAVVLGGDRSALRELRSDSRLKVVFALAQERILEVPEPRREILDQAARRAWTIMIHIESSEGDSRRSVSSP
jgi:hypothetical protein